MKITLSCLDGRVIAIASPSHMARWTWITETIAAEFGCNPDDVHEDPEDETLLTVHGVRAVRAERFFGWRGL